MGQALWGISPTNTVKPNWLTDAQKENTIATKSGWAYKHPSGIVETLVSIANLSGKLGAAAVTAVRWLESTIAASAVGTLYVDFDEPLAVTGVPSIVLTGGAPIDSIVLVDGGTGYTEATAAIVGDGFGATASVVITDGVLAVTLVAPGSGYRTASVVITGDGIDAEFTATLGTAIEVTATFSELAGVDNSMVFTFTAPAAPDTLAILAQSIALNAGTIVELDAPGTAAVLAIGAEDLTTTLPVTA